MATVSNPGRLSKENFSKEEKADESCCKQNPGSHRSKSAYFLHENDVMYRRQKNGRQQLVVPWKLISDIIEENHAPKYVAHPGIKRSYRLICLKYWWPNMRKAIEEYIRKCDPCQKRKENREFTAPLGEVTCPKDPF
jgi:hypothetical protein